MKRLLVTFFLGVQALSAMAVIELNPIFTDHMVLQRNQLVPIYGTADPGENVAVEFAEQIKATTANGDGDWQVELNPMEASAESRELKINSVLHCSDVLIGDIWLCAGQSNMARDMGNYSTLSDETESMDNPLIRLFKVKREGIGSPEPSTDLIIDPVFKNSWQVMTPKFAKYFSATGIFFGNALQPQVGVPIGLLYANRGGTKVNQWLPLDFMKSKPALYARYLSSENPYWKESKRNPKLVRAPSYLYNGTIHPLLPFAIRGAIWYQGESDAVDTEIYAEIFSDLIQTWRGQWGYNFPFLFVQLAPYGGVTWDAREEVWAFQREAQASALALPNTGMAVITDAGELLDIHPQNKQPVGERLALLAAKLDHPQLVAESPMFKTAKRAGSKIRVTFKNCGTGLTTRRVAMNKNRDLTPGEDPEAFIVEAGMLEGFILCGEDKKFVKAQARIVGSDTVEVWADSITKPTAVRYGWRNFPLCNLYNQEGLPASPFRSDDFPPPDFSIAAIDPGEITIGTVRADIRDDFNRADSEIPGDGWKNSRPDSTHWAIENKTLTVGKIKSSHYALYNTQAVAEKGSRIELSASISSAKKSAWGGLVFNYQDPENFYILRIKFGTGEYQLLCYKRGKPRVVDAASAQHPFKVGGAYTLRLQANPRKGIYAITLSDSTSQENLLERNKVEVAPPFISGMAGLYGGSSSAEPSLFRFDDFEFKAGK